MMAEDRPDGKNVKSNAQKHFLIMLALVSMLVACAVYSNIWKGNRRVAQVVVEGNRIVAAKDILMLANVPMNTALFDVDLYAIELRVMKNEYVEAVAVHRDLPDRIRISVTERTPVAALTLDRLYYLSADGYVLPPTRSQFTFDLPVITGMTPGNDVVAGRQTKNSTVRDALTVLSLAREIDEDMYRNISELHVDGSKDFVFYTAEFGIPVVLGRDQAGLRLVKFNGFWKSVVSRRSARDLQYIDLRFEDQVVVRWNHNESDVHS